MNAMVAFLTGCGRSGTTVLGTLLSKYRDVRYFNDQQEMWAALVPAGDIWKLEEHSAAIARVSLGASDATPRIRERVAECLGIGAPANTLVVEKTAINNFRLPFLRALFPEAVFINIVRHGCEVARSIAAAAGWYGREDSKWPCLEAHAAAHGYGGLLPLCVGSIERGLLEWRMSVDAADAFFAEAPGARVLRVRYEDLVNHAEGVCAAIERFLGLPPRPVARAFAVGRVARQSPQAGAIDITPRAIDIAGPALARLGYLPDEACRSVPRAVGVSS